MLDGRSTVLEAVRALVSLGHTDAIADVDDRRLIIGIESETDDLPVGEVRKLWPPHMLEIKILKLLVVRSSTSLHFLKPAGGSQAGLVNDCNRDLINN